MRTIIAAEPGPADITIDIPNAHLTVSADPAVSVAEIVLSPVVAGDSVAAAAIEAARVRTHGARISVRVRAAGPANIVGEGVSITGGVVVAGTIGGRGNVGAVSVGAGAVPVIRVVVRVPAGSEISSEVESGSVTMSGPLRVVWCERGPVVDLTGVTQRDE